MQIKGFLFDLDGVLTDTANYHYEAWKILSDTLGLTFHRQMNEQLKGVSRLRSFEIILEENNAINQYSKVKILELINKKNEIYKELIKKITPNDILPGVKKFLSDARDNGIKLAVASASRNACSVLQSLNLISMFDYIADASIIIHPKPDPEIFLNCAQNLNLKPEECIGFEDAQAGIEAIKAARMLAVGIGVTVTSIRPDIMLTSTLDLSYEGIMKAI